VLDADRRVEPHLDTEVPHPLRHQGVLVERTCALEQVTGEGKAVSLVVLGGAGGVARKTPGMNEIQSGKLHRSVRRHGSGLSLPPGGPSVKRDAVAHPPWARNAVGLEERDAFAERQRRAEISNPPRGNSRVGTPPTFTLGNALHTRSAVVSPPRGRHDHLDAVVADLVDNGADRAQDCGLIAIPEDHDAQGRAVTRGDRGVGYGLLVCQPPVGYLYVDNSNHHGFPKPGHGKRSTSRL
jgi:hypothetical protein